MVAVLDLPPPALEDDGQDTDDLEVTCPVRSSPMMRGVLEHGLHIGRCFVDPDGNVLTSVDEIAECLRRHRRVLDIPPARGCRR